MTALTNGRPSFDASSRICAAQTLRPKCPATETLFSTAHISHIARDVISYSLTG